MTETCRYCGRPIYLAPFPRHELGDEIATVWNLVYREYAVTTVCDARSDGANVSTLPHQPVSEES
jgi:hypothetical protein